MSATVISTCGNFSSSEVVWEFTVARGDRPYYMQPNAEDVPKDIRDALRAWLDGAS